MRIYLIGFMGSGKSTIGRAMARTMECDMVDLDRAVEQSHNLTIPQIFELHGEATFRKWESDALREHSSKQNIIIATGGGTPCVGDNMDFMLANGLTIYLKHDAKQLSARLATSHTPRPLLQGKSKDEITKFVKEKLEEREEVYNRSTIIVSSPTRDASRIVELVTLHQQYNQPK